MPRSTLVHSFIHSSCSAKTIREKRTLPRRSTVTPAGLFKLCVLPFVNMKHMISRQRGGALSTEIPFSKQVGSIHTQCLCLAISKLFAERLHSGQRLSENSGHPNHFYSCYYGNVNLLEQIFPSHLLNLHTQVTQFMPSAFSNSNQETPELCLVFVSIHW